MLWPLILIGLGIVVVCHVLGKGGEADGSVGFELLCGAVCAGAGAIWLVVLAVT